MGFDLDVSIPNIRIMYRRFLMMGYTIPEAGNMVANLLGLHGGIKRAWNLRQIEQIIFLKEVISTRIAH